MAIGLYPHAIRLLHELYVLLDGTQWRISYDGEYFKIDQEGDGVIVNRGSFATWGGFIDGLSSIAGVLILQNAQGDFQLYRKHRD